jgi:uncharacterized protein with HEPN domain
VQRDPLVYLDDILKACRAIQRYTADLTFESFADEQTAIDAVVRNFQVIGEAAKNIPLICARSSIKSTGAVSQDSAMSWFTATSTLISI